MNQFPQLRCAIDGISLAQQHAVRSSYKYVRSSWLGILISIVLLCYSAIPVTLFLVRSIGVLQGAVMFTFMGGLLFGIWRLSSWMKQAKNSFLETTPSNLTPAVLRIQTIAMCEKANAAEKDVVELRELAKSKDIPDGWWEYVNNMARQECEKNSLNNRKIPTQDEERLAQRLIDVNDDVEVKQNVSKNDLFTLKI